MSYLKSVSAAALAIALLALPTVVEAQRRGGGGGARAGAVARPAPRGAVTTGRAVARTGAPGPYYNNGRHYGPYNHGYYRPYPYYGYGHGYPYPYYGYGPSFSIGFSWGYPGPWAAAPFGWGAYGGWGYGPHAYGGWGYPYAPYVYGYPAYAVRPYGSVKIAVPQRDAEVYADGYFLGVVDQFDGNLQQANLETGPHRIEVRKPGFETIAFDVNIEPGRTITYRTSMRAQQP